MKIIRKLFGVLIEKIDKLNVIFRSELKCCMIVNGMYF